jgi:hypothetical protein
VSAIGTLIALGAAILIAIIGFLWFPIRRLMRRGDDQPADDSIAPDALGSDAADASTDPDPTDRP